MIDEYLSTKNHCDQHYYRLRLGQTCSELGSELFFTIAEKAMVKRQIEELGDLLYHIDLGSKLVLLTKATNLNLSEDVWFCLLKSLGREDFNLIQHIVNYYSSYSPEGAIDALIESGGSRAYSLMKEIASKHNKEYYLRIELNLEIEPIVKYLELKNGN